MHDENRTNQKDGERQSACPQQTRNGPPRGGRGGASARRLRRLGIFLRDFFAHLMTEELFVRQCPGAQLLFQELPKFSCVRLFNFSGSLFCNFLRA